MNKICGYTQKQAEDKIQNIVDYINSTEMDEVDDIYKRIYYVFRKADDELIQKVFDIVSYQLGFTEEEPIDIF